MGWLHLFQKDLRIGGTVEASTVREVLKVVSREELPRALRYVAEKIQERQPRDHHYRERVDFGLVLTILRQDYRLPGQAPLLRQKQPSVGSTLSSAISGAPGTDGVPPRASEGHAKWVLSGGRHRQREPIVRKGQRPMKPAGPLKVGLDATNDARLKTPTLELRLVRIPLQMALARLKCHAPSGDCFGMR